MSFLSLFQAKTLIIIFYIFQKFMIILNIKLETNNNKLLLN